MLRTALQPRWVGLLAVVVLVGVGFVRLGQWQFEVAREDAEQEALQEAQARPVVELARYWAPHAPFPEDGSNQRVRAVGRYEPERTSWVVDRRLGGVEGYWVLTPLVDQATGARIPVVRGFVAGREPRAQLPTGVVTVVGSLAPTESPRTPRGPLQPGEVASVDVGALLNRWGGEVYNGFLFALDETPDQGDVSAAGPAGPAGPMVRVPPPALPTGVSLRNAAYGLQWWLFAAFALWMWATMVRHDHRRRERAGDTATRAGEHS